MDTIDEKTNFELSVSSLPSFVLSKDILCVLVAAQSKNVQNYVKHVKYDIFIPFCFQTCWTVEMNICIPMRKQQGRSVKRTRLNVKT